MAYREYCQKPQDSLLSTLSTNDGIDNTTYSRLAVDDTVLHYPENEASYLPTASLISNGRIPTSVQLVDGGRVAANYADPRIACESDRPAIGHYPFIFYPSNAIRHPTVEETLLKFAIADTESSWSSVDDAESESEYDAAFQEIHARDAPKLFFSSRDGCWKATTRMLKSVTMIISFFALMALIGTTGLYYTDFASHIYGLPWINVHNHDASSKTTVVQTDKKVHLVTDEPTEHAHNTAASAAAEDTSLSESVLNFLHGSPPPVIEKKGKEIDVMNDTNAVEVKEGDLAAQRLLGSIKIRSTTKAKGRYIIQRELAELRPWYKNENVKNDCRIFWDGQPGTWNIKCGDTMMYVNQLHHFVAPMIDWVPLSPEAKAADPLAVTRIAAMIQPVKAGTKTWFHGGFYERRLIDGRIQYQNAWGCQILHEHDEVTTEKLWKAKCWDDIVMQWGTLYQVKSENTLSHIPPRHGWVQVRGDLPVPTIKIYQIKPSAKKQDTSR